MDLDDIWDAPIVEQPTRAASAALGSPSTRSSPPKRRRTNLFLSSGSEDEGPPPPRKEKSAPKKVPDIDALFDDLDDDGDLNIAPALDLDQLRKQADAKYVKPSGAKRSALPDSQPDKDGDGEGGTDKEKNGEGEGGDGQKKRKPIARLDEARLIGPSGFPALAQQAKEFQPRGKGHEVCTLHWS